MMDSGGKAERSSGWMPVETFLGVPDFFGAPFRSRLGLAAARLVDFADGGFFGGDLAGIRIPATILLGS
jgi:hypothetical protein